MHTCAKKEKIKPSDAGTKGRCTGRSDASINKHRPPACPGQVGLGAGVPAVTTSEQVPGLAELILSRRRQLGKRFKNEMITEGDNDRPVGMSSVLQRLSCGTF